MELIKIQELLSGETLSKLVESITNEKPEIDSAAVKQYDLSDHNVMKDETGKRPKKKVYRAAVGVNGQPIVDPATNDPIITTEYKDVTRIPVAMQKYIVSMRKNFLLGNGMERDASPVSDVEKNLIEVLNKTWEENKLDYKIKDVITYMMSETEVAVICYTEDAEPDYWVGTPNQGKVKKIRTQILRSCFGDALYPSFDQYGDMIAFSRAYTLKNDEGKEVEHFDVYTAETNYFLEKIEGSWRQVKTSVNTDKKIPVVYFSQESVEWADVQRIIDHLETSYSDHGDTNKYFAAPIAVFKGVVKGLPDRDETGKAIELEGDGADAKYMTWDQAPESTKLEQKNLVENIELFTGTPFITMERMSGLGTFSGVALKMLFALAHLKASEKEAEFAPGIQRLLNLLKSLLCQINTSLKPALNLAIKPKFTYFLPKNEAEELENLNKAKDIMSLDTRVIKNPLVEDGEAELEKIIKERDEAFAKQQKLLENAPVDPKMKVA